MLSTIKGKFVVISVAFIVFAVGIPIHFLVQQFRENFHQRSQIMLESTLDMLDSGLDNVMTLGAAKDVQKIIMRISETKSVNHIRLFNHSGIITQSSEPVEIGKSIFELAPDHVPQNFNENPNRQIRMLDDFHAYAAFQPVLNKPECQSCHNEKEVISFLDVDTHLTTAEVQFYTGSFHLIFLGAAVIIVLCIGLLLLFNKYINKPIQKFSRALDLVEEGDLNTRLDVERKDEFGKLNSHFNKMVNEIQSNHSRINTLHQEQLLHSGKLATIGELTSQMAHEINNFTGIALTRSDYLTLEAEKNKDLIPFKDDLVVIQNEILKVSEITKNVLRHSKKKKISFVPISIYEIFKQTENLLMPVANSKNITFEKLCHCKSDKISGDASLLDQLFTNLIWNSIDATQPGGNIKITCSNQNGKTLVVIEDNGSGMPPEIMDNIFLPFFTTKADDQGTGLGLYIVKNICDLHNATIECDSLLNKGTKFRITFNSLRNSDD